MANKLFSERYGYKKPREVFQIEELDRKTLVRIWDLITENILFSNNIYSNSDFKKFYKEVLHKIYSSSISDATLTEGNIFGKMRHLIFENEISEIFDMIEIAIKSAVALNTNFLISELNKIFEEEMVQYKIIEGIITPITDENEVREIEKAIDDSEENIRIHLNQALEHLSDRENPDYRNSIKESISAVEASVRNIIGKKGTLGILLKKLDIHPSLKDGYSKIYGYTSDGGIRHAIMDDPNVGVAEAKYFLISCSAFVNMLQGKLVDFE